MFKRPLHAPFIVTIAALGIIGSAVPAQAADSADNGVELKKVQRNGTTVYCAKQTNTGSRVPQRICMTKSEWANRGTLINDPADDVATAEKDRNGQS